MGPIIVYSLFKIILWLIRFLADFSIGFECQIPYHRFLLFSRKIKVVTTWTERVFTVGFECGFGLDRARLALRTNNGVIKLCVFYIYDSDLIGDFADLASFGCSLGTEPLSSGYYRSTTGCPIWPWTATNCHWSSTDWPWTAHSLTEPEHWSSPDWP